MKKLMLLASAAALAFSATVVLAQGTAKKKAPAPARTAISLECSKQADAKSLHGKARKAFRSKCKRDSTKAGKV